MKILVVDDEILICQLLEEFLSIKGHCVTYATQAEQAVREIATQDHDMILLDIRMPDASGLDLLRQIRSGSGRAGVIMLSAFGDDETVEKSLQMGANYYMQKPIELEELAQLLEKWQAA